MLVVGLTGGIGAGKSTVASLLAARGARVVDVDGLGREVLAPGGEAAPAVAEAFGPTVQDAAGAIDRAALARLVFADAQALERLTRISHPIINRILAERLGALRSTGASIAVLDMAVLAETRLGFGPDGQRLYDVVVVVEAPWDLRLHRLVERGMSVEQASARRAAQAGDDVRRALADRVIVNDGDRARLSAEVDELWNWLVSSEARGLP